MVGRATIGQPWIFEEMKHYLQTGEPAPRHPKAFYVDVLRQLVDNNIRKLDERRGILHSRRHIAASPIFKGIDNFRPVRIAMLKAATREELSPRSPAPRRCSSPPASTGTAPHSNSPIYHIPHTADNE